MINHKEPPPLQKKIIEMDTEEDTHKDTTKLTSTNIIAVIHRCCPSLNILIFQL